jgi:hypothetical protein
MSTEVHLHQAQQHTTHLNLENGVAFIAGAVGVIFSFFNWYGVSTASTSTTYLNAWHGWGIPAAVLLLVAAVLGAGRWLRWSTFKALAEGLSMAAIGLLATVCTIIFMATEGSGYGAGYDKGPLFGAVLGLICAIIVAVDGALLAYEGRRETSAA